MEEPLDNHVLTGPPGGQRLPLTAQACAALPAAAPDPAQVAGAVDRFLALREFRARLYGCLTARADALFELCDAILCADHAVTSLAELSLVPEFRRGHGALYDALAAGQVDEEALAALLTQTLPQLVDGPEALTWIQAHDTIDYGLLEQALAGVPAAQAAQIREACARWRRLRFAVDATPYPRPDAECSPGRGHVNHDAAATAPARPSPAGSTSSSRRSGTCAPPGPRWPMSSGPRPPPVPPRPRGRSRTCCAACTQPAQAGTARRWSSWTPGTAPPR